MPNLWLEQARGQRRPQHHAQSLVGVLISRNVDMGSAIDVETVTLDILDDTHEGHPWLGSVSSESHPTAQWIARWPILMRGAFVNDGHQRFAVFIVLGKCATAQ